MRRMELLQEVLMKELSILELGQKIKSKVSNEINEDQKKYFLREQMKAIKKELGDDDPKDKELRELKKKIEKKKLSDQAKEVLESEMERLEMMNPMMPDYNVARTYIDWILDLPWNEYTVDNLDIVRAERILNEDHYDLEKVKERILEYLAVRKLQDTQVFSLLLFQDRNDPHLKFFLL